MPVGTNLRSHCAACGTKLTQHERFAGGVCNGISCRRRRVDAQNEAEMAELRQLRDASVASAGLPTVQVPPVVVVSWYETGLEPVPQRQREALQQHLMALQAEVDAMMNPAATEVGDGYQTPAEVLPVPQSQSQSSKAQAVDSLLGRICARCTGYCCRDGNGRHAFLDAAALVRARLEQPGASHAELVDAYLAEVPDLHHAGSCVFHGERGCVLPRHRRSDMCNSWECPGLREARQHAESSGAQRVFVVRGRRGQSFAADFVPPLD